MSSNENKFSCGDNTDRANIHPKYWGSQFWKVMHMCTYTYPTNPTKEQQDAMKNFFEALEHVLPCSECRNHFSKMIKKQKPIKDHLYSQEALTKWLIDCHNEVNQKKGKPKITYDEANKEYGGLLNTCMNETDITNLMHKKFLTGWLVGGIMSIIIVSIIYYIIVIKKIK